MRNQGTLFLFPCPIQEGQLDTIPPQTLASLHKTTYFLVERAKTARHFLKAAGHPVPIANLVIQEISAVDKEDIAFLECMRDGIDVGIISEAGCPGIADPGSVAVNWAHQNGIRVRPMVGPSSILLAMMASGLNGQSFAFNGYLPAKAPDLVRDVKMLESKAVKTGQAQIFMEAPYRNDFIIKHLLATLQPSTRLCIACDVNGENESIHQQTVTKWRETKLENFHKRPCIFIIG